MTTNEETISTNIPVKTLKNSIWEFIRTILLVLCIVIPIRMFIAQPFVVSGHSMSPTFEDKDYLIVDEISYRLKDPQRFDVIVFKNPQNQEIYFIKRIIGLPGETIEIDGGNVIITSEAYPDGLILEQPYVAHSQKNKVYTELRDGEYFVMGDNRSASSDSRIWGALRKDLIVGRALVRLLPIKHIDLFPGFFEQK